MIKQLFARNRLVRPLAGGRSRLFSSSERVNYTLGYKDWPKPDPLVDHPTRRYVFMGLGAVSKVVLTFMDRFVKPNFENVLVVDKMNLRDDPSTKPIFDRGCKFLRADLTDEKLESVLDSLDLKPFDVIVDLTCDTNSYKLIESAHNRSLIYINTSLELREGYEREDLYDSSLLKRHDDVRKINSGYKNPSNASQVYEFGANPGLISHFAFQALLDISKAVLERRSDPVLEALVKAKNYNLIAKHLRLETIHVSELDTQVAPNLKDDGTFVNTWSVMGMLSEAFDNAQAGWGTHEKVVPASGKLIGPNQMVFKEPAIKKYHLSYVPDQEIIGSLIPHGEAVTLTEALTAEGYAPTVHYVYRACDQTLNLLDRMTSSQLQKVSKWRILNPFEDKLTGEDRVGALLLFSWNPVTGENKPWSYWFGSILGQGMSPFLGPTPIQVGIGTLTALKYIVENNSLGPLFPEQIPTDYVLRNAIPYLGRVISQETGWIPPSTQFAVLSALGSKKKELRALQKPSFARI